MVYLKNNIQIEPLVNGWFAWIHLIAPATGALNMVRRYMDIMNSYITSPQMHAAAISNPFFKGGPFIDLDGKRVEDVKSLRDRIQEEDQDLFEFVAALEALEELLRAEAKGFAMETLYEKIPEPLKGYVDLYYDLDHKPGFKLLESLLYASDLYKSARQSLAISEIVSDTDNPFIMSTPRLEKPSACHVAIPFNSEVIDELVKMKKTPGSLAEMREKLQIKEEQTELFNSFFTEEEPIQYNKYTGENARVRYFGHACILIETAEVSILVDPVLSYTYESDISRYTYEDLPDTIDYVLITHSHHDHILIETMLQIRHKVKQVVIGRNLEGVISDPSLKLLLNHIGYQNVLEIRDLEKITIPNGTITGIPFMGEHHDLFIHSKSSYFVEINGNKILIMADSCNVSPEVYRHVHKIVGDTDVLFLGMECDGAPVSWPYGPLYKDPVQHDIDKSRRGRGSNFVEAIGVVDIFNPKEAYVYAMGEEPWIHHILGIVYSEVSNPIIQSNQFVEECQRRSIVAGRLFGEKEILMQTSESVLVS
ncbi:MAG: MBL fold metallo-hydrolase [Bacteroidota bacterium]